MRLTDEQVGLIKRATAGVFGEAARVRLFGSRVDDRKRGGDVDGECRNLKSTDERLFDRLDQADRLGWIESSDEWMVTRKLRNQMIHGYIEDLEVLAGALQSGHERVAMLLQAAERMLAEIMDRGWLAQ